MYEIRRKIAEGLAQTLAAVALTATVGFGYVCYKLGESRVTTI